jgi:hypothetical protein
MGGWLDVPTPRRLYVHDDLSADVARQCGAGSEAARLAAALLDAARRAGPHVHILTLDEQIEALIAGRHHDAFDVAIGIGRAGERVARQVHERCRWFPRVRCVGLTREEAPTGEYRVVSTSGLGLDVELKGLEGARTIAVVDDTVFSGLTMRTVLATLGPDLLQRTHAFCLRAVGESLERVAELCPVAAGVVAPGRRDHDVSFINASGLVRRGSIRRAGQPPLAFFDRPTWIRAWFPSTGHEVIGLSRRLNHLLEPDGASL